MFILLSKKFASGDFSATCVVPPKPVTLQKRSYRGTEAYDNDNIIINTAISWKELNDFFL